MLLQQISELQKTGGAYIKAMESISRSAAAVQSEMGKIQATVTALQEMPKVAAVAKVAHIHPTSAPARHVEAPTREKPAPNAKVEVSGDMTGGERKVLESLATLESCRVLTPSRSIVAALAGYSNPKSGGFTEPVARLAGLGFAETPRGSVRCSPMLWLEA